MANLFVELIKYRLNSVNSGIDASMEEHNDSGDRKWSIGIACEEKGKITDDLRTVKYATDMGEKVCWAKDALQIICGRKSGCTKLLKTEFIISRPKGLTGRREVAHE